jgi:hypothetical protein
MAASKTKPRLSKTTPPMLKNGVPAHVLTPEQRRKGGLAAAAKRRQRKEDLELSFRERLAKQYNAKAEAIASRLIEAGEDDWRAIVAGADQAFGRPPQEVIGAGGGPLQIVVTSAFAAVADIDGEAVEVAEIEPAA